MIQSKTERRNAAFFPVSGSGGIRRVSISMRSKRASIMIAAATAILVGTVAVMLLTTQSSVMGISKSIRGNLSEKYNREAVLGIALDNALQSLTETEQTVSGAKSLDDCSRLASLIYNAAAPSGVIPTPELSDMIEGIPFAHEYKAVLSNSYGKYANPVLTCRIPNELEAPPNNAAAAVGEEREIPLNPFLVSVSVRSEKGYYYRTWEIRDAVIVVEWAERSAVGHVSLQNAAIEVVEQVL